MNEHDWKNRRKHAKKWAKSFHDDSGRWLPVALNPLGWVEIATDGDGGINAWFVHINDLGDVYGEWRNVTGIPLRT